MRPSRENRFSSVAEPDPHRFGRPDPDLHQSESWILIEVYSRVRIRIKVKIKKQLRRLKMEPRRPTLKQWRLTMEPWRFRCSHNFDKEQDPDQHQSEKSDPDPRQRWPAESATLRFSKNKLRPGDSRRLPRSRTARAPAWMPQSHFLKAINLSNPYSIFILCYSIENFQIGTQQTVIFFES